MPTDNNINGKAFLKLRGSDLLDLFPDNFILNLHSVYSFQHPTYKHSHALLLSVLLRSSPSFTCQKTGHLQPIPLPLDLQQAGVVVFFINSVTAVHVLLSKFYQMKACSDFQKKYIILQPPKEKEQKCPLLSYTQSSKDPCGVVTFSHIIESPVLKKMAPCPQKCSVLSVQNDICQSHVLQATSDTPIQAIQMMRSEKQGATMLTKKKEKV